MEKKGYELRKRKTPTTLSHTQDKTDTLTQKPKMEVDLGTFEMKDISENGSVNHDNSDVDEENTLFDQTSLSTPLLSSGGMTASPEVVIEEDTRDIHADESWWTIGLQVFFPFLVAGFGTVGAGMVLDIVQVIQIV